MNPPSSPIPPPWRKYRSKEKLWSILDAQENPVLWSDQEQAIDTAVAALNAVQKITDHIARFRPKEIKTDEDEAWNNALGGIHDILTSFSSSIPPSLSYPKCHKCGAQYLTPADRYCTMCLAKND